jgi:2-phospho-L-lactate guanylyltransferase (CobY/MobA/RfbA family)
MPTVIVPFRRENAKARLAPLPDDARGALATAMLADVLAVADAMSRVTIVAPENDQGEAVELALRRVESGSILVVNADLPCAEPRDLLALLGALPDGGMALVEAPDGTTNALALAAPHLFAPLYGPGSAERFRARAARLGVQVVSARIPNLVDDVDTVDDLERLESRLGPHTAAALGELRAGLVR